MPDPLRVTMQQHWDNNYNMHCVLNDIHKDHQEGDRTPVVHVRDRQVIF